VLGLTTKTCGTEYTWRRDLRRSQNKPEKKSNERKERKERSFLSKEKRKKTGRISSGADLRGYCGKGRKGGKRSLR